MTITANESIVMNRIARHEMNPNNGEVPESHRDVLTYCWVEDFHPTWPAAQVKGVIGSLSKKGLVLVCDGEEENTIEFTPAGFDAWAANWG
jgi:hypothetical protein